MDDKKVANSELVKLRRTMELRKLALAEFYPTTHSGIVAHRKLTEGEVPRIRVPPLPTRLGHKPTPPERVAKHWKNPWDK
jgi:hypothetical protein